jgi:hypothetical protein
MNVFWIIVIFVIVLILIIRFGFPDLFASIIEWLFDALDGDDHDW